MPKSLTVTPWMKEQISLAVGDSGFNTDNVSVYETWLINTRPLTKPGSIFDKGRPTAGLLHGMADYVQQPGNAVHMHTLHQQDSELPIGRVFFAETQELADGETGLRGLFYVPNSETELTAAIDNSVIDEVSVGVQPDKLLCSECGFDYRGPNADIWNLLTRTCENEHTIGIDGVHLRLVGMDRWDETSLVSKGAANNAKILSRSNASIGSEEGHQLAANGAPKDALYLFASANVTKSEKEGRMANENGKGEGGSASVDKLVAQLVDQGVDLKTAQQDNQSLKDQVEDLKAQLGIANEKLEATDNADEVENLKVQLDKALSYLKEQAEAALKAAGKDVGDLGDDIEKLVASIKESGAKLHILEAGTGGRSASSASGASSGHRDFGAFKTRKEG